MAEYLVTLRTAAHDGRLVVEADSPDEARQEALQAILEDASMLVVTDPKCGASGPESAKPLDQAEPSAGN